jgi:hypothetical protein
MVRVPENRIIVNNVAYVECAGLSTDDKPLGVATGSLFLEVDTGDVYSYDETGAEWDKIAAFGGGGS